MEILLISRCPPFPLYRGDRLIPYYLAHELTARRHQIDLLAFYDNPADIADVPRYEALFRTVKLIREPQRSLSSYLRRARDAGARFPSTPRACWSTEMWSAIDEAQRTRAHDVVHVFGGIQVYEYRALVQRQPNIIVPYESYSLWLQRALSESKSGLARISQHVQLRVARSFESWMFTGYDRTVVLTERDAGALRALAPSLPLAVIPNGVDIDNFLPTGYEPDRPALLFVGNYDYAPNLDAALRLARDLFPRIQQRAPQARLVLVGGNPPPALQALASDAIAVTGRVPDLRPYYEQALIFVSPLRLGAGIKNKVLEALAMQVPVVATPLSCDGIPVAHEQHVLLGTSDEELVNHVMQLLRDGRLRQTLRANGRQLIEQQFTWSRVADQYEALYDQVIRERRGFSRMGRV